MHLITFKRLSTPAQRQVTGSMGDAVLGFEALEPVRRGQWRLGAILTDGSYAGDVVDLNRALAVKFATEDSGAPEAEADSLLPAEMLAFLRGGSIALDSARSALSFVTATLEHLDAPDLHRAGVVQASDSVRLCAPIPRPGKIIGVLRNYIAASAAFGAESTTIDSGDLLVEPPKEPELFLKAPSSVIGPADDSVLPEVAHEVDYEGELAAIVGTTAHRVNFENALDCIAGYCIANDVTARDFQNQQFLGKSCDTFAPLGPALVTRDEIKEPQNLWIRTTLSGETVQEGRTSEMYFSLAETIHFASQLMTLEPGDVILTGTPAGIGAKRSPSRFLRDGDIVEIEIEGLGRLLNYVRNVRAG